MGWGAIVISVAVSILAAGLFLFILSGFFAILIHDEIKTGDRIHVYFESFLMLKHNRTATIDDMGSDRILIYEKLPIPLDYVGRFYAVGLTPDSVKLVYVKERIFIIPAMVAELIRKIHGKGGG